MASRLSEHLTDHDCSAARRRLLALALMLPGEDPQPVVGPSEHAGRLLKFVLFCHDGIKRHRTSSSAARETKTRLMANVFLDGHRMRLASSGDSFRTSRDTRPVKENSRFVVCCLPRFRITVAQFQGVAVCVPEGPRCSSCFGTPRRLVLRCLVSFRLGGRLKTVVAVGGCWAGSLAT